MIIVTGDPQRPLVSQKNNLDVMRMLIKHDKAVVDLPEISMEDWMRSQTHDYPSFLSREVTRGDMVIGFEMPRCVVRDLDDRGIDYVNIVIYPVRYMPDLIFGVKSNRKPGIGFVSKRDMAVHAHEYKGWIGRNIEARDYQGSDHLVVGQTEFDRSVLYDGKFHKVEEYVTDMTGKTMRGHPDLNETSRRLSIYRCFPHLKTIEGINSSCLFEAEMFGVPNVIYHGPKWWEEYTPVYGGELFNMAHTPPNFFRNLFGNDWSYERRSNRD